jgi:hypothetical protein
MWGEVSHSLWHRGVTIKIKPGSDPNRMEDVDSDADLDMLFHFDTQILAELAELNEDSTEATLTGVTKDGIDIRGTDSVNIVPKK